MVDLERDFNLGFPELRQCAITESGRFMVGGPRMHRDNHFSHKGQSWRPKDDRAFEVGRRGNKHSFLICSRMWLQSQTFYSANFLSLQILALDMKVLLRSYFRVVFTLHYWGVTSIGFSLSEILRKDSFFWWLKQSLYETDKEWTVRRTIVLLKCAKNMTIKLIKTIGQFRSQVVIQDVELLTCPGSPHAFIRS